MINTADELIVTNANLFPDYFSVRLKEILSTLESVRGKVPDNYSALSRADDIGRNAFQFYATQIRFNEEMLRELYIALYVEPLEKEELAKILDVSFPTDRHFKSFREGCGLLYLFLWGHSDLVLSWKFNQSFLRLVNFDHTALIPNKLWSFTNSDKKFKGNTQRLILMSDWNTVADISLSEVWDAVRTGFKTTQTNTNFRGILNAVLHHEKCQFSEKSLKAFEALSSAMHLDKSGHIATLDIEQLTEYHSDFKAYGKDQKRKHYGTFVRNPIVQELKKLASENKILEYSKLIPQARRKFTVQHVNGTGSWWRFLNEIDLYPGREKVRYSDVFSNWIRAIEYFDLKQVSSGIAATTNRIRRGNILVLVDYIFLYLPWYQELNNHPDIQVPYKVSDFKRWAFWSNEPLKKAKDRPAPPLTAIEFYKLRRSKATLSSFINTCSDFFDYVISAYFGESDRSFRFYPITFSSSLSSLPVLP